jgi:hypothetical protein
MKRYTLLILAVFFCVTTLILRAQEMVIIPGGVFEDGDRAEVTGDHVRVRSGPTLEHRIITKVNRDVSVTILERGEAPVEIKQMKNYWYKLKIEESGVEGWMFGSFLRKSTPAIITKKDPVVPLEQTVSSNLNSAVEDNLLKIFDLGLISQPRSILTTGDLNRNGLPEIIFINGEERRRSWNLIGYEGDTRGTGKNNFTEAYRLEMRNNDLDGVRLFEDDWLEEPLVISSGHAFSYIYSYDANTNLLRLLYKINSPILTIGNLDGKSPYLIYLQKNRVTDNDGTETYYIHAARFEKQRNRILLHEKLSYSFPLPVKKILSFDFTGNSRAEIVCEVGGNEKGGGIVVLSLEEGVIKRVVNSGIATYNDAQFVQMWGVERKNSPMLFLYTTNPEQGSNADTSFGFLSASMQNNNFMVDRFFPVNKMLDDINNNREALFLSTDKTEISFVLMDYDETSGQYRMKRVLIQ